MGFLILRSEPGIDFFTPLFKFNLIMSAGFSFCLVGGNRRARNEFRAHDPSSCIFIYNDVTISINDFNIFILKSVQAAPEKKIGHLVFFFQTATIPMVVLRCKVAVVGEATVGKSALVHIRHLFYFVCTGLPKKDAKTRMANAKIKR